MNEELRMTKSGHVYLLLAKTPGQPDSIVRIRKVGTNGEPTQKMWNNGPTAYWGIAQWLKLKRVY